MKHPKRSITRQVRTRKPRHPGRGLEEREALMWPESVRVADRMTAPVATIRWDAFAGEAGKLMADRKIRHLPVVDGEGRLVGIVTDRDLRQVIFDPAIQEDLGNLPVTLNLLTVRDIMTWGVITVAPSTEIRRAARLMYEQKIGALPVVERDKVIGILTESDVLKSFVEVVGEGIVSKPYRWAFAVP